MSGYGSSKTQAMPDKTTELDWTVGAQARRPYFIGDSAPRYGWIWCTGDLCGASPLNPSCDSRPRQGDHTAHEQRLCGFAGSAGGGFRPLHRPSERNCHFQVAAYGKA